MIMKRKELLDKAAEMVCGQREQDYGTPEDNFKTIADLWQIYIKAHCVGINADVCLNSDDVAALMVLLKVARIASGSATDDSWIDIAGYAACGGEISSK